MKKDPVCIDCIREGVTHHRPITGGGPRTPRCDTHRRAWKRHRAEVAHAGMVRRTYSITAEQYAALYAFQGGKCALCQVATGKTKRLAVDHDHKTGLVRGLLCGPCNKDVIGRLGRDALQRGVEYLDSPPGRILVQKPVYDFMTHTP